MKSTQSWGSALRHAVPTGTLAGTLIALTAGSLGKVENGRAIAPINAVSHILWGDQAARRVKPSLKYTGTGLALNEVAAVFWGVIYEKFFGLAARRGDVAKALAGGAVVAAAAYVTDYHIVPKRLTPGFEKRLSGRSLFGVYAAMALSLGAGALLTKKR